MESTAPAASQSTSADHRGLVNFLIGVVAIAAAYAILALNGVTVDDLVHEDSVVEWAGAIGLFAGAAMFLASFVIALRRGEASGKSRLGTLVLLAFAVALLFLGGEEVSWGQRLLGFGTPEAIYDVNAQGETTLHNLEPFQGTSLDGDRLFRIAWFGLFVIVPVVAWLVPRLRARIRELLPLAPLWLAALFVVAYVFARGAEEVFAGGYDALHPIGSAATEIQEATVEILMAIVAFLTLRDVRAGRRGD